MPGFGHKALHAQGKDLIGKFLAPQMYIQEVVMDGFKCYSDKMTIRGMDPSFNAITGLNGSGKSNVIDAVIFALDLSSSKLMRVATLKELINIHRKECTVTVHFDNRDKARSPSGYEHCDMIEVSRFMDAEGRSKYRMNGHSCTKMTIEKMCRSVGITNDFIVMQGHITKVLNMKATELRNMIEEVAGTRSYNAEKERARQELEKKELKLREARGYLKKSVSPFLDELMKEKKIYDENKEFEERRRMLVKELEELERCKATAEWVEKVSELEGVLNEYIEDKMELDGVEDSLREANDMENEVDVVDIKSRLEEERLRIDELGGDGLLKALAEKKAWLENNGKVETAKYNKKQLLEAEQLLSQEACNGRAAEKIAELESLNVKMASISVEHQRLQEELVQFKGSGDKVDLKDSREALLHINTRLNRVEENANRKTQLTREIESLKVKLNYVEAPGVYGTVDENYELKDDKYNDAVLTLLGGRMKFIICENDEIASGLLKSSDRKISCIPLNKITVYNHNKIAGKGVYALDAVRYDGRFERAFKHLLSGYYIFEDKRDASTFCHQHKVVCVTLDGTVYDPKGTLTGGKAQFKQTVIRSSYIKGLESELARLRSASGITNDADIQRLQRLRMKLQRAVALEEEISAVGSKIELLEKMCGPGIDIRKELAAVRAKIVEATKAERLRAEHESMARQKESEVAELERRIESSKTEAEEAMKRFTVLQNTLREVELKNSARKNSVRMLEGLELRRKHLIRSTAKHLHRITRLREAVGSPECSKLGAAASEENRSNRPGDTKDGPVYSDYAMAVFDELQIDSSIFSHGLTGCSREETLQLGTRIAHLKEGLAAKRSRCTMDPSNFELLEKNVATIKDLESKIAKLEEDKSNIIRSIGAISELGIKENEKAFAGINENFKKFFSYFIPNAAIEITPDFEIRVEAGGWKKTLSELSGGQRSLIALSLIFSMLAYRPAPFYIFDEVDAALDQNYTQGVGEIIRKEFQYAQFVIISLKPAMIDNANRVYRVYIQDHKSKIAQVK